MLLLDVYCNFIRQTYIKSIKTYWISRGPKITLSATFLRIYLTSLISKETKKQNLHKYSI